MDFEASIIDQQLTGIIEKCADFLPKADATKQRAFAFVLLCMKHYLDISLEDAADLLTEGGNDVGVDGLHIGEIEDGEFTVTLFQCKYKIGNLDGTTNFPENGVKNVIMAVQALFDPSKKIEMNNKLREKVNEIRSLIQDTYIPNVRIVLCNNGLRWKDTADIWIHDIENIYQDKVTFEHFNHKSIVKILKRQKTVDTEIQLTGQILVEDMNYIRVLIGRVSVQIIAKLMQDFGEGLLQRNIRRYLGLHNNRVNLDIHNTLCSEKCKNFYFYNNGITIVCSKFDYNAFQKSDFIVRLKNMQIINGGQTCKTIHETLKKRSEKKIDEDVYVMLRIYQLSDESDDFVQDITYATNSQNPVDLRDLRSNDDLQRTLELGMRDLGYTYKRQREESKSDSTVITSSTLAEATLAIWREKPHQAKFRRKELFGMLYKEIFSDLSAAQAIVATRIFRDVESERKRHSTNQVYSFIPYASHYISMVVGRKLLCEMNISLNDISHKNFVAIEKFYYENRLSFYEYAVEKVHKAILACYGNRVVSQVQLAATFRRGDLLEMLA